MSRDTRRKQIIRYWQRSIESKSFNGSPAGDGERRERGGGEIVWILSRRLSIDLTIGNR